MDGGDEEMMINENDCLTKLKKKKKKHSQFINGKADEGNGKQTSAVVR